VDIDMEYLRSKNNHSFMWVANIIFAAFSLVSCSLFQPAQTPETGLLEQPERDINLIIAQTAEAAQTLTVTHLPSPTKTYTPTLTPIMPTATQTFFFSLEGTLTLVGAGSPDPNLAFSFENLGPTNTPEPIPFTGKPWTCIGAGKYPPRNGLVAAGEPFTATWSIINTGTKDWSVNAIDLVYKSGYRHVGKKIQDLHRSVKPGESVTWFIYFVAPKASGAYASTWQVVVGHDRMCGITITFEVKAKE